MTASLSSSPTVHRAPRVLSLILVIIGVLVLVGGIAAYAFTSAELSAQRITVSAVSAQSPGPLAGRPVVGPFTALAQANAINAHAARTTGGLTFAELGKVASSDGITYKEDVAIAVSTDGEAHLAGELLSEADARTYAARALAEQAALLQSSLFLSVLAFGVSALAAFLGILTILIGFLGLSLSKRPKAVISSATD
ncbi:MAG: hypothetical protein LBU07_04695 [Coriobacteriales bacterium]|jgi:hypothetical protein|nr:hypothetical protein [Coriobacteriales bacterium]